MPASMDTALISHRFRQFKNMDPGVYEATIRLLNQYVMEVTVAVTEAPPDQILNAQGRAQQAIKFFQIFTELPEDEKPPATNPGP